MTTKLILNLFLAATPFFGQTCADNNTDALGGFDITSDTSQHLTENHTFNGGAESLCSYGVDRPAVLCHLFSD